MTSAATKMLLRLAQHQRPRSKCDTRQPDTPDTTSRSSPLSMSGSTADGMTSFLFGDATAADGETRAPVFAGLPTPENSPLSLTGNMFDFSSSSTSLWSGVLRHADDATAVSELAAQFRQVVDAAAAAVDTVDTVDAAAAAASPTLRDLVCNSGSLVRPFPVTHQVADDVTSPTFLLCHSTAASTYDCGSELADISAHPRVSSFPFPPSAANQLCANSTTLSDFDVNRYMTYAEDLDDVDNDELDQYLGGMSTDSGKDFDLVVDQVDSSLSAAAHCYCSSPASDLTSVSVVAPPQQIAVKTEFNSADFAPLLASNSSPLIATDFAAGVPDSRPSETSSVDELAATFDATATNTVNSSFQTRGLVCSTELGNIDVCDSSSSSLLPVMCDSINSMLPISNALSRTSNLLLPFVADSTILLSSPFDGGSTGTCCPTWTSNIAVRSSFPTTNNTAIDSAAISGKPTAAEVAFPLPTSTTVKQELPEDIEFSWSTDDSVVDCDFCDTTLNEKNTDVEDYDGTDLLEVLADVPTV